MSGAELGRLRKVDLRQVWTSEPGDFTPWLAREDNLALLGETIGIELELDAQEKAVGPFRADILCKDTTTDEWVLIENQLERTDHTHLGQLLTYAAGLNAVTIVWIAERFTEEHRAALDWINERTDEHINLFGLEIELWQIGSSEIAPKFNVVSQPNGWSRSVRETVARGGDLTEHGQLQLRFWTAFCEYMEKRDSLVRCQKPAARQYTLHAIGRAGAYLSSVISTWNSQTGERTPEIRAEFVLSGPLAKPRFAAVSTKREQIEAQLRFPVTWHESEEVRQCRVSTRCDADFTNEALWPEQFEWLRKTQEAFYACFSPLMQQLRLDED